MILQEKCLPIRAPPFVGKKSGLASRGSQPEARDAATCPHLTDRMATTSGIPERRRLTSHAFRTDRIPPNKVTPRV